MPTPFRKLVKSELDRYKRKINGYHEAYGIILEELDEFWEQVRKKTNARDPKNALLELTQIAALCEKAAVDLNLIDNGEE